jgi:hypothetical protein
MVTCGIQRYGIAYGVLDDLSRRLKCRSLFSTHYHLLTKEFEGNREIALYHMGCLANKETCAHSPLPWPCLISEPDDPLRRPCVVPTGKRSYFCTNSLRGCVPNRTA